MALNDLISCAPFRLPAPRPLTAYEWNIVGATFAKSLPMATASWLVAAVAGQSCQEWKTSAFGPAPAVSTCWYDALARWFASLGPAGQPAAIASIQQGALCRPGPWQAFATKGFTWEGDLQNADNVASSGVAGLESCAAERQRAFYMPITGADLLTIVKLVMAAPPPGTPPLPPVVVQMIQNAKLPEDFAKRTFLLGLEIARPGEPMKAIMCSEIALIWAPGQGASIAEIMRPDGSIDLAKAIALLQMMAPSILPSLLPGLLPSLPQLLPQILPQIAALPQTLPQTLPGVAQQLPGVLTAATQVAGAVLGGGAGQPWVLPTKLPFSGLGLDGGGVSPQTPPNTGVAILDGVAGGADEMSAATKVWLGVAAVGVVSAVLLVAVLAREPA